MLRKAAATPSEAARDSSAALAKVRVGRKNQNLDQSKERQAMSNICTTLSEEITVGSTTYAGAVVSLPASAGQVYRLDDLIVDIQRDVCSQELSETTYPATSAISHLIRVAPAVGPNCDSLADPCIDFAWLSMPPLVTGTQRGSLATTVESGIRASNWAPAGWVIWAEVASCAEATPSTISVSISFSQVKMTAAMEREILDSLMIKPCLT